MTTAVHQETWHEANQRYVVLALEQVRRQLERQAALVQGQAAEEAKPDTEADEQQLQEIASSMSTPPAIERITQAFGLSPFERNLLLLCAGLELDSKLAQLCGQLGGATRQPHVTFSLAMAALGDAHWSALTPTAPLRYWRMLELGAGESLTHLSLRLDETILHYLAGIPSLDDRFHGLLTRRSAPDSLLPSSHQTVHRLLSLWPSTEPWQTWPVIQLVGSNSLKGEEVAASMCDHLGLGFYVLQGRDIPHAVSERMSLARLWNRQWLLTPSVLLVNCEAGDGAETVHAARNFVEQLVSPCLVSGREPLGIAQRRVARADLPVPTVEEQREQWHHALGPLAEQCNGQVDNVIAQFRLNAQAMQAVGEALVGQPEFAQGGLTASVLWDACRSQARARLDGLAQRITSAVSWGDLVLPDVQKQTLREIAAMVRQRTKVYDTWGFGEKETRGLGIAALFAGASGTGKTLAAEVLANELRLDLYRIDLSQVISKYIGETEKNLHRVFEAAEDSGAVLLFDEADAIFGRRSEVKDSHDRYANIEVSYLLQRMEAYRGLAILTTNMKEALDPAFLRRIRFVVDFPFPNLQQRAEIWARVFPAKTPTEGVDLAKLARLTVPGGNIRNMALNAAFLAADGGEAVHMKHLLHAARSEYAKLGKPLAQAETAGWL